MFYQKGRKKFSLNPNKNHYIGDIMKTSKITLKSFIKEAPQFNPSLIRAVVSQCSGWDEFKERALDVANYGGNSGTFGGFIYYKDTVKFTKDHRSTIVAYYTELANDLGEDVISMVKGFNLIKDQFTSEEVAKALFGRLPDGSDEKTMIYNVLSIGIQEEVCNAYINFLENLED